MPSITIPDLSRWGHRLDELRQITDSMGGFDAVQRRLQTAVDLMSSENRRIRQEALLLQPKDSEKK